MQHRYVELHRGQTQEVKLKRKGEASPKTSAIQALFIHGKVCKFTKRKKSSDNLLQTIRFPRRGLTQLVKIATQARGSGSVIKSCGKADKTKISKFETASELLGNIHLDL